MDESLHRDPQADTRRHESLLTWLSLGLVGFAIWSLGMAVWATIDYVNLLGAPRWSASIGYVLLALAAMGFSRVIFPPIRWVLFFGSIAALILGAVLVETWLQMSA